MHVWGLLQTGDGETLCLRQSDYDCAVSLCIGRCTCAQSPPKHPGDLQLAAGGASPTKPENVNHDSGNSTTSKIFRRRDDEKLHWSLRSGCSMCRKTSSARFGFRPRTLDDNFTIQIPRSPTAFLPNRTRYPSLLHDLEWNGYVVWY